MTAFPNQANIHNQASGQTHAPVPSSYPPTNFMTPSGVMANKNTNPSSAINNNRVPVNPNGFSPSNLNELNKVKSQATTQMKPGQMPNRSLPAPLPGPSNTSHMMGHSAQQMPNSLAPPNMKSQFPSPMPQIMHKPNMANLHMNKMNVPTNVAVPAAPSTPMPSSLPPPAAPAPAPVSKSKSSKKSKKNNSNHSNQNSNVGAHGENTGRWTQEEHRLFLEGLEKHGKGWKKIASLIKSRTVVQIRTHAQKYFQKLAKARHNGEEGDVSMEGRGVGIHCGSGPGMAGGMSIPPLSSDQLKRRRSGSAGGTKRKTLETVVTSARREGKRLKEVNDPLVMPSISPCLAPFVMHPGNPNAQSMPPHNGPNDMMPSGAPTLEDSLYRFLTPMSADYSIQPPRQNQQSVSSSSHPNGMKQQTQDPNNQNHYIVLPNNTNDLQFSEGSPTCVSEIPTFQTFPNNKLTGAPIPPGLPNQETPQWYARGADVDELLHDADALNWLADSGDINEPFHEFTPNPVQVNNSEVVSLSESEGGASNVNNNSGDIRNLATDALPPVVSSTSSEDIHGLPNLFDTVGTKNRTKLSTPNLFSSGGVNHSSSSNLVDENFSVFDSAMDEQAFVSALLESNENAVLSVSADM